MNAKFMQNIPSVARGFSIHTATTDESLCLGLTGAVVRSVGYRRRVPGSRPGWVATCCGLEQVILPHCLNPGSRGRKTDLERL